MCTPVTARVARLSTGVHKFSPHNVVRGFCAKKQKQVAHNTVRSIYFCIRGGNYTVLLFKFSVCQSANLLNNPTSVYQSSLRTERLHPTTADCGVCDSAHMWQTMLWRTDAFPMASAEPTGIHSFVQNASSWLTYSATCCSESTSVRSSSRSSWRTWIVIVLSISSLPVLLSVIVLSISSLPVLLSAFRGSSTSLSINSTHIIGLHL